ncbi:MAG: ATP-grasp domain protein [Rhodothermales bacterium]
MHIAYLSTDDLSAYETDEALTEAPLVERGCSVDYVSWHAAATDWSRFDAVIIRTPWDYHEHVDAFLAQLEAIKASGTRLFNPLSLVRWNADKRYLRDLEQRGIAIVPTVWGEADDIADTRALFDQLGTDAMVVKPVVSAGAMDTFRLHRPVAATLRNQVAEVFARRPFMAQPFVNAVVAEGEFSVFFFGGVYSHAILKTPKAGDFRVQEEFGSRLQRIDPTPALMLATTRVMDALNDIPLYARVDVVRMPDGSFALMEFELIEPGLYFRLDPPSATRFAEAILNALL